MNIQKIEHAGKVLAIILKGGRVGPGVHFATENDNPLQVGRQRRMAKTKIAPHAHCAVAMNDRHSFLQEVLHIEQGRIKVIFYTDEGRCLSETVLDAGDTILLIQGGHGFEILEDTQMLEVKMGPYDPASKKNIEAKT